MSPCLYHWIGRPDRSGERIREIIDRNYSDSAAGLPGNDDSGAMSSWLIFNMAGIYPNAGHDYYLIHSPVLRSTAFHMPSGKDFTITTEGLSDENRHITAAYLNGEAYPYSSIRHSDMVAGGELRLVMGNKPSNWGKEMFKAETHGPCVPTELSEESRSFPQSNIKVTVGDTLNVAYRLHGQTRRFRFVYEPTAAGGLTLHWSIVRNLKLWTGSYAMSPQAVKEGTVQSWLMPEDGNHITLPSNETFGMISRSALASLKKKGEFVYNGVLWKRVSSSNGVIEVEDAEEARMRILDNTRLPLILSMSGNPLEIDWNMTW